MTRAPKPPSKPGVKPLPPAPKRRVKGTPPAPHETLGALTAPADKPAVKKTKRPAAAAPLPKKRSERTKALNFSVTANFRKAFKLAAEAQNCKKVELLETIFAEWQNRHPV